MCHTCALPDPILPFLHPKYKNGVWEHLSSCPRISHSNRNGSTWISTSDIIHASPRLIRPREGVRIHCALTPPGPDLPTPPYPLPLPTPYTYTGFTGPAGLVIATGTLGKALAFPQLCQISVLLQNVSANTPAGGTHSAALK